MKMPLIKKDMPFNQCELVSHFEQLKKLVFVIVNVIIMGFKLSKEHLLVPNKSPP
jgi:hypothetical protein